METTENHNLDAQYWDSRYHTHSTGWDIGYANKIHTDYVEQHCTKDDYILIPGAGSAYEAEYLWLQGYQNIYAIDFSPEVKSRFLKRVPSFPAAQYLTGDFFELKQTFDVVLEQTFFCAIDPSYRKKYAQHIHNLLNNKGVLYGVLFEMNKPQGPPYGGDRAEYRSLFSPLFHIEHLDRCSISIPQRQGNELIIKLIKK